jgi:hypothetical protein
LEDGVSVLSQREPGDSFICFLLSGAKTSDYTSDREEDVGVRPWTKGRRGGHLDSRLEAAVSTGGEFKATFNEVVRPEDAVYSA